ncbi:inositol polyphosphate 5-phosphatase k [Plakobranchus ocellatus]|uniref:Inositol polyphosphate 5-phosphatase k n=1 Tax=Plakobranchus ocellatus TaxID=259542 RepID=A0AAV4C2P7_9GAST|nr:inositol polyphosphate 5-phosphatase k [Plakobranchus ocellatus]
MATFQRDGFFSRALSRISLRIYLVTWNVNGKAPPDEMDNLLQLHCSPLPDIYAIGLQEVSGYDWEKAFTNTLFHIDFVRVKSRKMQGIHIFLFIQRSLLPYVSNVESEVTRTGFGGFWGNKGGTTVRLDFKGVNIVVVNCHLAAHREEVMSRIEHVDTIIDSQKFKDADSDNILDHDYIFWMGDMNFRLEELSRSHTLELIHRKDYATLLKYDQLSLVMEEKLIFEDFQEGQINFPPTYKFDNGTDDYDTSEKRRVPAYTDRILYFYHDTKYGPLKLNADVASYRDHSCYKSSDHRPVSAVIAFSVPSRSIHGPVTFDLQLKRRPKDDDNKFFYTIRKDFVTSSDDWVGLYKAHFPHFDSYITYQWVSHVKCLTNVDRNASVTFRASQTYKLDNDAYVVCYMTRKGSLCGISDEFWLGKSLPTYIESPSIAQPHLVIDHDQPLKGCRATADAAVLLTSLST